MRWKLGCAALSIALLCLSAIGSAGIKKSETALVSIREHNFIESIQQHGLGPASLSRRQIYLLIRLGAAYEQIVACAPPSEDAKALARSLTHGLDGAEAWYSQEDDYAAAEVNASNGNLFSRERSWDFDLGALVRRLQSDGWEVFGGVRVASDAKGAIQVLPAVHAAGYSLFPIAPLLDRPIHLEAHLSTPLFVLPFVVAFGPMVALILGFIAATAVAKRKDIVLERRRKLYSLLARYPLFGMIALCLPLSIVAIFGGLLVPVADLWFGTSNQAAAFIPIVFLGLPVSILALIPMSRIETRLFSDLADKPDFQPAKLVPLTKTSKGPQSVMAIGFIVAGAAVLIGSITLFPKGGYRPIGMMVGYGLMMLAGPFSGLLAARKNFPKMLAENEDPLVKRVLLVAQAGKCQITGVDLVEPRDQNQRVAITAYASRITITRKTVEELSESALDFGIAFALMTKTARTMALVFLFVVPLALVFTFLNVEVFHKVLQVEQRGPAMLVSMLLIIGPMLPYMNWLTKTEARRQIRDSLRLVSSRSGAIEWIEKSMAAPLLGGREKMFLKRKAQFLAAIDQAADDMGLAS
jgi:hypothetical protein